MFSMTTSNCLGTKEIRCACHRVSSSSFLDYAFLSLVSGLEYITDSLLFDQRHDASFVLSATGNKIDFFYTF